MGSEMCIRDSDEIVQPDVLTEIFDTPVEVIEGPRGPLAVYY